MIDTNIKEFCRVVTRINELNEYLDKEKKSFYDEKYSFEECYSVWINELEDLQREFRFLFRIFKITTAN